MGDSLLNYHMSCDTYISISLSLSSSLLLDWGRCNCRYFLVRALIFDVGNLVDFAQIG